MKISSINSYNYNNSISFTHTAVPYPEYENSYYSEQKNSDEFSISKFIDKVSSIFSPKVKQDAVDIKTSIDTVYNTEENDLKNEEPNKQLLSVFA